MLSDHDVATCPSCGRPIRWAITARARRQAVDAAPDPAGNLAVHKDGTGTLKVRVLSPERPTLEHAEWQAMPHAATCPAPRSRTRPAASRPGRRAPARPAPWQWTR
ncbi:hypothetical protein AB0M23_28545 [Streptomyces sp. NPDC052077]|uniref:hypothetical protein n=1 Tax=Streptomyces sp. NPDC052077 TaxID=3154757 RepID=UPI003443B536